MQKVGMIPNYKFRRQMSMDNDVNNNEHHDDNGDGDDNDNDNDPHLLRLRLSACASLIRLYCVSSGFKRRVRRGAGWFSLCHHQKVTWCNLEVPLTDSPASLIADASAARKAQWFLYTLRLGAGRPTHRSLSSVLCDWD